MGPTPPLGGGHDGGYGTSSTAPPLWEAMTEAMGPAPPLGEAMISCLASSHSDGWPGH